MQQQMELDYSLEMTTIIKQVLRMVKVLLESETARTAGTHGNGLGVSICSSATAYEQTAVTTTSGTEALGQTVISVTDASTINVGDIVNFGETFEYETTARNTTSNEITIKLLDDPNGAGLQSQITSGTNIRRRWRFYDLFDGPWHI